MAANFPNSPNINDTFTSNGVTFKWDGTAWKQPSSPGVKGTKGDQGEKGEKGQKGEKGEKGTKGEIGSSGNPGGKGDKGAPGADGSDGSDGDKGQKGEKGQKGQDGADATGTKGQKGDTGSKGQKGEDGSDGSSVKGQKGEVGTTTKGQKGEPGQKGQQGASGSASISNNADNRVITGGTGTNLNAEQNLTFDGSTLNVSGSGTPTIESASELDITATTATFSGTASFAGGHPTSNFYSGADDLVVANFTQDTGISIMSGTSNAATVAFGSTTFGTGAIEARLMYESNNDNLILQTQTSGHDIKLKSAGAITLGDLNDVIMTIEDPSSASSHGVEVSGTIYPKAPVGNLGLSGVRWNNIYGNYLHGNGASITNIPYSALTGTPSIPSIPSSLPAKSIFAHNYGDTTYGSNAYNSYQNHLSASLTPSNSNNRVVVMASFQLKRGGSQNNNWYAYAKLAGGGDLQNIEIVRTNGGYSDDTSFKLIAYDAAGNTSSRTYYLQVKHSSTSSSYSSVSIRHASIVAIELSSS